MAAEKIKYNYESAAGHCIALSLEDLSVWCYECNAYLVHDDLTTLVKQFEQAKFGRDDVYRDQKGISKELTQRNLQRDLDMNEREQPQEVDDISHCDNKVKATEAKIEDANQGEESEQHGNDGEEDEIASENFHPYLPETLNDLAKFIQSDDCQSIIILAGAGMSRASGSECITFQQN